LNNAVAGASALLDPKPYVDPVPEPPPHPPSRRGALIALALLALLIVGALYLEHVLHDASNLQDCVMQGRTNCAPIDASSQSPR